MNATDPSPRIAAIIEAHRTVDGPALPIFHAIQREFGYVPEKAVPMVANALNLSRAEVHGIVSFYHDFRRTPPGRHVLKLCRAEACQALGCDSLHEHAKARTGIGWHETTADAALTIEPVYCLGLCASGPAALLDGQPLGRLDRARLDDLIDGARR